MTLGLGEEMKHPKTVLCAGREGSDVLDCRVVAGAVEGKFLLPPTQVAPSCNPTPPPSST